MRKSAALLLYTGALLLGTDSLHASADKLQPAGYALYQEFGVALFAFELQTPDGQAIASLDNMEAVEKSLGIRVLADHISSRHWCRFWSQNISINLTRPLQGQELDTLRLICDGFPDLVRGDLIEVFSQAGSGTRIEANKRELVSRSGPCLNSLLLTALLGSHPANSAIPQQLRGRQDSAEAARAYHQTAMQPARINAFIAPPRPAAPAAPATAATPLPATPAALATTALAAASIQPDQPQQSPAAPDLPAGVSESITIVWQPGQSNADSDRLALQPASAETEPRDRGEAEKLNAASVVANRPDETTDRANIESADLLAMADYQRQVMAEIYRHIQYPRSAQLRGQEDQVRLHLRIGEQGELLDVALLEPSRFNSLNIEAQQAAERAAPFPAPMSSSSELQLMIPVSFRLTSP